jgi:hypothetical protein
MKKIFLTLLLFADFSLLKANNEFDALSAQLQQLSTQLEQLNNQLKLDACINVLNRLNRFVESQAQDIEATINMVNRELPSTELLVHSNITLDFTLVDGSSAAEIERQLNEIVQKLKECHLPQAIKDTERKRIENNLATIRRINDSLTNVTLLISDSNDEAFYEHIKKSFNHLSQKGLPIDQAYEVLDFSKDNRYEITPEQIIQRSDELAKEYPVETARGAQIRQVKFTLGEAIGKKIYDAFLGGKEHLAMLRISPHEAQVAGLDYMTLNEKITVLRSKLIEAKAYLSNN